MGLLRLYPTRDAFISNKRLDNGATASGSNVGGNPTWQLFKVTSSFPAQPAELARTLVQYDIPFLRDAIASGTVPDTSAFYLKAFHYNVNDTVPSSFDVEALPVTQPWDQGIGQDDKLWRDYGYANWASATSTSAWVSGGGDYTRSYGSASQHFDAGTEDLELNVTALVQAMLTGALSDCGFMLKLSDACERNGNDYYRKVFYAHETVTVAKLPYLEARWEDAVYDNRGNVAYGQPSNLLMYNFVRGQLRDLNTSNLRVRVQDNIIANSCSYQSTFSASRVNTGTYLVTLNIQATGSAQFSSSWNDIWEDGAGNCYMSGVFRPLVITGSSSDPYYDFSVNPDYKRVYRSDEVARVKVPVIIDNHNDFLACHTASINAPVQYMESMHYSVIDNNTNEVVIPFATGSLQYTKMSYNKDGNYFNIWMNSLTPGFTYRFAMLINFNKYDKTIVDQKFVFKVE